MADKLPGWQRVHLPTLKPFNDHIPPEPSPKTTAAQKQAWKAERARRKPVHVAWYRKTFGAKRRGEYRGAAL